MSKHPVSFRIGRICRLFITAGICLCLTACGASAGTASSKAAAPSGSAALSGTSATSAAETSAEALPVITVITETSEEETEPAAENTNEGNAPAPSAADGTFTITFAGDILMDPDYAAGDALTKRGAGGCFDEEALGIMRDADLFVVNNEFAYTSRGTAVSKQYNFRADPENVQILKDM